MVNLKGVKNHEGPYGTSLLQGGRLIFKTCSYGKLAEPEIYSCRRSFKKAGLKNLKTFIFAYLPTTKKPAEVRMGKGKGSKINSILYPIRPGQTLFTCRIWGSTRLIKRSMGKIYNDCRIAFSKISVSLKIRLVTF